MSFALATAGAAGFEMKSYVHLSGKPAESLLAWCDAPKGVFALTQPQDGQATLYRWGKEKGNLSIPDIGMVEVGQADAGAGQLYYPLSYAPNGKGHVHISNVENTSNPAYRMTRVNEFKLGNDLHKCRYVKDAAFIGVTNKRTVIIWDESCPEPVFCKATYATRNFNGTAGVLLKNGERGYASISKRGDQISGFRKIYFWRTPDNYQYDVEFSHSGGTIVVRRDGKTLSTEPFLAYTVSLPKK